MYDWLARLATRRARAVLVCTLVLVGLALFFSRDVTDRLETGGTTDPGTESMRAAQALDRQFPLGAPNLVLRVRIEDGSATIGDVDEPGVAAEGTDLARRLAAEPSVEAVASYWQLRSPQLRAGDGRSALVLARIRGTDAEVDRAVGALSGRYRGVRGPVEVSVGGTAAVSHDLNTTAHDDILRAELIGIPLTAIVLMIVFRSIIAALLPLLVGGVAMVGTIASLRLLSQFTDVSVFALNLTTGLSLGLATDYALFIVQRHRDGLRAGLAPPEAVRRALNTAGRTVLLSSATVAVAIATMLAFPMYFLRSFAYAGVMVAVLAALAAVVALPAGLIALGGRVNAWDPARLLTRRTTRRTTRRSAGDSEAGGRPADDGWRWRRLAEAVMRRPVVFAVLPVAALLVLGLPFRHVVFGIADDRSLPAGAESRTVAGALRTDFGALPTGAVEVVAEGVDPGTRASDLATYATALSTVDGVLRVDCALGTFEGGRLVEGPGPLSAGYRTDGATYLTAETTEAYQTPAAQRLVTRVRQLRAPFPVLVGGPAAQLKDSRAALASRLGPVVAVIAAATLVLVFLLTGGVLVAFKALLMNALSLTATFGVLVWAFQDGGLAGVLGFQATGWMEVTMLVLLFCVAFGVSMDYEVFILSRIREEYAQTGDNRRAVAFGMARNGGLVTAAAVVLSIVFLAMGAARVTDMKMFGLGLATAILLDAFVVRAILVPALMRLAGSANWWAPGPLRRFHARYGIRHGEPAEAAEPPRLTVPVVAN